MVTSKYFSEGEFNNCSPKCSLQDMNQEVMDKLDKVRELVGQPLTFSCAYRSSEWDKSKGRSGTGSHTVGRAMDILCSNSNLRFKLIKAAIEVGFTRIGCEGRFIHLDDSPDHPKEVVWVY